MRFLFGGMPIVFFGCVMLFAQLSHAQSANEPQPDVASAESAVGTTAWKNLADVGHGQGLHPLHTEDTVSFRLPLPLDVDIRDPRLDLHYAVPVLAETGATLQVTVNGTPRELLSLSDFPVTVDEGAAGGSLRQARVVIPLGEADLNAPFVDVDISANWYATADTCMAPGRQRFFRVLAQTAVVYELVDEPRDSIRGFLTTLPESVDLAMEPWLGAEAIRAAWLLTRELKARGHNVGYAAAGERADIVISTREALAEAGTDMPPEHDMALISDGTAPGSQRLAIVEPYHVDALAGPWSVLLAGDGYAESLGAPLGAGSSKRFRLEDLGADVQARSYRDPTEWTFRTDILPTGRAPEALRLDMIIPPSSAESPLVLYILQNNVVRGLKTLPAEGGQHSVALPLSEAGLYAKDPVRVVLKGQGDGPCQGGPGSGYAQLLDTSVLETTEPQRTPETIAEFSRGVGGPYSVHLPADAFGDPAAWVNVLSTLGTSLGVDPRLAEFSSVALAPVADRPFLWLGPEPPEGFTAPIQFDRGRIQVQDRFGAVLLDSGELPGIQTVSLVRSGDQRGLWLRTFGDGVPTFPPSAENATGDLLFGDARGVLVSIDTRNDAVASVAYPEQTTWLDTLARFRGWIFAAAWLLLTIVAVVVARKLRKNSL